MRTFVSVLVVLAGLAGLVTSHSMELGSCRAVKSFQNFEPDKFEGLWHVIEITSTSSRCMTMNFTMTGTGFSVTEVRQWFLFNKINLDHTFTNRGTFTFTNPSDKARMSANWKSNILGSADVTIVDTDYTQFAVLYECQSLVLFRRTSLVLLSRQNTLDSTVIDRVKNDLRGLNININKLDEINHDNCKQPGEADFDLSEDSLTDLFTSGSLGQSKKSPPPNTNNPGEVFEVVTADNTNNEIFNAKR